MKTRLISMFLLAVMALLSLVSCGSSKAPGDYAGGSYYAGAVGEAPEGGENGDGGEQATIPAGQLTAAEWNDAENYAAWLEHFYHGQTTAENGVFLSYIQESAVWQLPYSGLLPVQVKKDGAPVAGAEVELLREADGQSAVVFSAVTDAKGMAYLFGEGTAVSVIVGEEQKEISLLDASLADGMLTVDVSSASEKQNVIELMFVIDTTGSMGDELEYIKAEVDDVIARVKDANPDVTVRLALLFYRDEGDEYVTRYFDFTDDIEAQRTNLAKQKSKGGGDYPEAVHTALHEAVNQQWSSGNTTKLIFHILDAPPHAQTAVGEVYRNAILTAAQKGIRIIPVASSGVDKETEYLLRSEALLTGGTYTFLTDDSGIGGDHLEPTVGQHTVEFLNSMLVRLICEFYTGEDIPPVDWRQEVKQ